MISCVCLIVLPAASCRCKMQPNDKSLLSGAFSSLTNLREALLLRIMAVLGPYRSCERVDGRPGMSQISLKSAVSLECP